MKYHNFEQLSTMLHQFGILYLKRRYGARGNAIIQVKKMEHFFEATRVIKEIQEKVMFDTERELKSFLQGLLEKNRYVIQQGVPFVAGQKQVDFRAYLQKDGSREWKVRGFIGRLAKLNSVVTNLKFAEKISSGKKALKEFYGFNEKDVDQIAQKIEDPAS